MMATYETDGVDGDEGMPSPEEINEMMVAKAHELFALCDKEQKVHNSDLSHQILNTLNLMALAEISYVINMILLNKCLKFLSRLKFF